MTSQPRVERVAYPLFVVSTAIASLLGIVQIWTEAESVLLIKVLGTALVLVIASGLTISATWRSVQPRA